MNMRVASGMMLTLLGLLSLSSLGQGELVWNEIDFADTNVEKHNVLSSSVVKIDGVELQTGYKTVIRSGAHDPRGSGAVLGRVIDKYGKPVDEIKIVPDPRTTRNGRNESVVDISHDPDFVSILTAGKKVFLLAHFESPNPGSSYLIEVCQDEKGILSAIGLKPVDWSGYGGLWVPCAGSVTPWGTHLGSEEFSPDAKDLVVKDMEEWDTLRTMTRTARRVEPMMRYFGIYPDELTIEALREFKPYMYGYPWEVAAKEDGSYTNVKHMAMGRTSVELPYVMPDQKTVYITDDGQNRVFTMFVAHKEKDLRCGELYAAKADQVDSSGGGSFKIQWIKLGGFVCENDLRAKAEELRFDDIFYTATPKDTGDFQGMCEEGFTAVNVDEGRECLKVKEGMETFASRFETRRYAGMMGATTEWNKWEGISFSPRRRKLYTALSSIEKGMEDFSRRGEPDEEFDIGGGNHVRVAYNPCGCVYALDIDEKYWVTNMETVTCGRPIEGDDDNRCDLDGIAGPDNVAMVEEHDGLLIGEDTSRHQNNVVWYMDLKTGEMTRVLSTPYGSETTGPYWHADVNGWSYMMIVVQHPYGESDEEKRYEEEATGIQGWIGYMGPFDAKLSADKY